jgi:hypothetical protein
VTTKTVAKRFYISLPDGIAEYLEEWAAKEGNKPTTLAAFIVERTIRERMEATEGSKP